MRDPSRVTLKQLRAFVAVAKLGSFSRASEHLALSQPALTAVIKQLEQLLGMSLFDRTTRRVSLAVGGEEFLPTAERLLRDFDDAITDIHEVANLRRGRVRIAALFSVATNIIPSAVREFTQDFPGVSIQLRDDNSAAVRRRVLLNEVDFGVAGREEDDPELDYVPVFRDSVVLVGSREHPLLSQPGDASWADIADHDFIGLGRDTAIRRAVEAVPGVPKTVASPRYETSNTPTLQALLEAGVGVSAVSSLAAMGMKSANLKWKLLDHPTIGNDVFLISRRGRSLPPSADRMKQVLLRHIRNFTASSRLMEFICPCE